MTGDRIYGDFNRSYTTVEVDALSPGGARVDTDLKEE
jgi:hypothetical protein